MYKRTIKDPTGKKFGRLTVTGFYRKTTTVPNVPFCKCRCDCGEIRNVIYEQLRSGRSRSCGCLQREINSLDKFKHGLAGTKIYSVWHGMIRRCYDPNYSDYRNYGGRGIAVCDRWKYSVKDFHGDIGDIHPGLCLDRIDNNGNYEINNVRLVNRSHNMQNTRLSKWWVLNRVWYPSLRSASEMLGISLTTVRMRCDGYKNRGSVFPAKPNCYSELKYPVWQK